MFSQSYKGIRRVDVSSSNLLLGLFAFLGTTVVGMLETLRRKINGYHTRQALVELAQEYYRQQRIEDAQHWKEHRELISQRMDRLEKLIKNGN